MQDLTRGVMALLSQTKLLATNLAKHTDQGDDMSSMPRHLLQAEAPLVSSATSFYKVSPINGLHCLTYRIGGDTLPSLRRQTDARKSA